MVTQKLRVHFHGIAFVNHYVFLSYNAFPYFYCLSISGAENAGNSTDWKCTRLKSLDISHNLLTSVPLGIRACVELTSLNVSYNELSTCSPWQCPMVNIQCCIFFMHMYSPMKDIALQNG